MNQIRKDWRWCKSCKQWVFAWPLLDGWCHPCTHRRKRYQMAQTIATQIQAKTGV